MRRSIFCLRLWPVLAIALCWCAHAALAQPTRVGAEFRIDTYRDGGQSRQSVAMDADGDFVVAWRSSDQDGSVAGVFAQRYDSSGAAQGVEFQVNTYTQYSQGANNFTTGFVAMEHGGDFVVTWPSFEQDGDDRGVFAQRFTAPGAPLGPEFRVNSYITGEQRETSIAMDADGDFVVIWNDYERGLLAAQRYDSSGNAVAGDFPVNTGTASPRDGAVGMDDSGNFVVAWRELGVTTDPILAQRFDSSGARIGGELVVATDGFDPAVGVDGDGDFVIVWTGAEIRAQRFDSTGSEVGAEFQVNEYTPGGQGGSSVSMSSEGSFVVAWVRGYQFGDYGDVFARSFGASGQALGGELAVNAYITGTQERPSVAMDDEGDFVVTWTGDVGAFGSGIFGQRFTGGLGPRTLEVGIDIKPKSFPNKINLKAGGWVTVAILTTSIADGDAADFDAFDVDPSTVVFGPADAPADTMVHADDVDGDGDIDMTLRFRIKETGIACGDTSATLTGETAEGDQIHGSDSVLLAGC